MSLITVHVILELAEQGLIFRIARLIVERLTDAFQSVDPVPQTTVGQGIIIIPTALALNVGNGIQHMQGFLIMATADVVPGSLKFSGFLRLPLLGASLTPERIKTKSEASEAEGIGVTPVLRTGLTAVTISTVAVGVPGRTPRTSALALVHNLTVSALDFFEPILSTGVIRVQIGVILLALGPVCFLDFVIGGGLTHAQYLKGISHPLGFLLFFLSTMAWYRVQTPEYIIFRRISWS